MSLVKPLGSGKWPVDSVNEEFCKIAADFFVSVMPSQEQLNTDETGESYRGAGIWITAKYLSYWYLDQVPDDLTSIQLASQLVTYWLNIESSDSDTIGTYITPIIDDCAASVCRALGWEGNSDLAGIGVFASYYIEAILTTIYLIPLIAIRFRLITGTDRISKAFTSTLGDMVQSVYVFSIAVMAASLYTILRVSKDSDLSVSRYDIITSILVSILATCPATALYAIGGQGKGPQYLLRAVLFAMWCVMLAVVNIGQQTDPSMVAVQTGKVAQPFDVLCEVMGRSPLNGIRIFSVVAAALGAIWIAYLVYRRVSSRKKLRELDNDRDMKWGRFGIAFLSWAAMWVFVGLFTLLRARIMMVSGESDKSNEWSFGQIVALATWAPVIINFTWALIVGVKKSHGERLPEGYEVTGSATEKD